MYRLLYSALWYLLCPVILLHLYWRSRKNAAYKHNWQQRLGYIEPQTLPTIWLHAVSVGETVAARPLVEAILRQYPKHTLIISNTTPTGMHTSKRLFGDQVSHCFFPYDVPHMVSRFLTRAKPKLLIIMETEIWPNLLHQCHQQSIPVVIANARLSERSTKGYARIQHLIQPALKHVTLIACRNSHDADRFMKLGAESKQLTIAGNIKFDVVQQQAPTPLPATHTTMAKILVAASTHQGEDEIILQIFTVLKQQYSDLKLILVPRHPERFDDVFKLCQQTDFSTFRRSESSALNLSNDILLGDSLGEMPTWYSLADVVFIGGSLVNTGGHNPLEATVFGVPVVSGPAIFNFQDVYGVLCDNQLAWVENDATALQDKITSLLNLESEELNALKEKAHTVLTEHSGVAKRLMSEVRKHLP